MIDNFDPVSQQVGGQDKRAFGDLLVLAERHGDGALVLFRDAVLEAYAEAEAVAAAAQ